MGHFFHQPLGARQGLGIRAGREPVEALRQAGIAKAKFYNFTPYVGAAILFLCISIPLTRFTDHLLARERRRMQGTAVR